MTSGRIVVFGATSQTGSVAVQTLLSERVSQAVVAAARSEEKAKDLISQGAEFAKVDFDDPASIKKAVEGATSVYVFNPPVYDGRDAFDVAEKLVKSYKDAILANPSVTRVVMLGTAGAGTNGKTGYVRIGYIYEQALWDLKRELVFLRPGFFMENWATSVADATRPPYVLRSTFNTVDQQVEQIATSDIGVISARYLSNSSSSLKLSSSGPSLVQIKGPKTYTALEVGQAFEKTNGGHKVDVSVIPDEELRSSLPPSLPNFVKDNIVEMTLANRAGLISYIDDDPSIITLRGNTSVETVIEQLVKAAA